MTEEYIPENAKNLRTYVEGALGSTDDRAYFKGKNLTKILIERGMRLPRHISLRDLKEPNGALLIQHYYSMSFPDAVRNSSFYHVSEDFGIEKLGDHTLRYRLGRCYRPDGIRVENYIYEEDIDYDKISMIKDEIIIPKIIIEYETIPSDFGHRYPIEEYKIHKTEEIKFKLTEK